MFACICNRIAGWAAACPVASLKRIVLPVPKSTAIIPTTTTPTRMVVAITLARAADTTNVRVICSILANGSCPMISRKIRPLIRPRALFLWKGVKVT